MIKFAPYFFAQKLGKSIEFITFAVPLNTLNSECFSSPDGEWLEPDR